MCRKNQLDGLALWFLRVRLMKWVDGAILYWLLVDFVACVIESFVFVVTLVTNRRKKKMVGIFFNCVIVLF